VSGDLSQVAEAGGVSGDEEAEQNEDIWLRADTTPPAKSYSSEKPVYDGTFRTFCIIPSTTHYTILICTWCPNKK